MHRGAHPGFAMLLVAACGTIGCAGGPSLARDVHVEPGLVTRVVLTQVQDRTTFLLQNASSADRAAFYGDGSTPELGKVVADEQLQALLDIFSEKGMFATSTSTVPPGARDVLTVEQGGRSWIWARRLPGLQASEATFHEAKAYFLDVYNSSTAYRGEVGAVRPDLASEQARVQQSAEAAKRRLEELRGRQR